MVVSDVFGAAVASSDGILLWTCAAQQQMEPEQPPEQRQQQRQLEGQISAVVLREMFPQLLSQLTFVLTFPSFLPRVQFAGLEAAVATQLHAI